MGPSSVTSVERQRSPEGNRHGSPEPDDAGTQSTAKSPASPSEIDELIRNLREELGREVSPNDQTAGLEGYSEEHCEESTVRYSIIHQIAAGGMGVIYRAKDHQLNRDVALKVMSSDLREPTLFQRFVNEARILAQLQHPGIPPVFEEGYLPDRQAFIAMKLVEGHTLEELLDRRPSAETDLRRYLTIFRQICETVAFAHANGVIHRDLKPDNVMVGKFSEVQVIDWGLAKRYESKEQEPVEPNSPLENEEDNLSPAISQDELIDQGTVYGIALGTPTYMPPEQGQGLHDQASPASDVFSLGAILCKILTGAGLNLRSTGNAQRNSSYTNDLEEAHQRLSDCPVDEVLKQLAIRCLEEGAAERPQHAGELVELLDEHLDSIQNRLWKLEVARAKEQEKQRQQRLINILAITASITIAILTTGWAIVSSNAARRDQVAHEMIAKSIGEVEKLKELALSHPLSDKEYWQAAQESIRRANTVITQSRVNDYDSRVEILSNEVRQLSRQASQDRQLIEDLKAASTPISITEMREQYALLGIEVDQSLPPFLKDVPLRRNRPKTLQGSRPAGAMRRRPLRSGQLAAARIPVPTQPEEHQQQAHYVIVRERYVSALSDYGIDPRDVSAQQAAIELLSRPEVVRKEVVNGMYRWFGILMRQRDQAPQYITWVIQVLDKIDENQFRNQVRKNIAEKKSDLLFPILSDASLLNHPPAFLWLISQQFKGQDEEFHLLLRARHRYPQSLVVIEELANLYHHKGMNEKAIGAFMGVLSIQEDAHTFVRTALCLRRTGRHEDAIIMCQNAIQLAPADSDAYPLLTKIYLEREQFQDAIDVVHEAELVLPTESGLWEILDPLYDEAVQELELQAFLDELEAQLE